MDRNQEIRRKALKAARAVTAGALLFAGLSCTDVDDTTPPGWDVGEGSPDVSSPDTGTAEARAPDTSAPDTSPPDPDVSETDALVDCSGEVTDGICPSHCHEHNDADCCEEWGGIWAGGCAIEGPFVPPSMPA